MRLLILLCCSVLMATAQERLADRVALERWLQDAWPRLGPLAFAEPAVIHGQHQIARLAPGQAEAALGLLNIYRRVAGLPHAVRLDRDLSDRCAHGAVVLEANGGLSHTPSQPEGMDDAFFRRGFEACRSSNLQGGFLPTLPTMLHFFMWDSDARNRQKVGHRRWVLNPTMGKTGFGAAGSTGLMWAIDRSNRAAADWSHVAWPPAGWAPLGLIPPDTVWSVQFHHEVWRKPTQQQVQVHCWRVAEDGSETPLQTELVAVDAGIGATNSCVTFVPELAPGLMDAALDGGTADWLGWPAGEVVVRVQITGLRPAQRGGPSAVDYRVHFFPWRAPALGNRPTVSAAAEPVPEAVEPGAWPEADRPSIDELRLLQLTNRFRADPVGEAALLRPGDGIPVPGLARPVDWQMFVDELAQLKAAPPLLPHPVLTRSARGHARWLAQNQALSHVQSAGSSAFTGTHVGARAQVAGWPGGTVGENVTGPTFGPMEAYRAFIVDWDGRDGSGRGGMQEPRGHRLALISSNFTRFGGGFESDPKRKGRTWVVQNLGHPSSGLRSQAGDTQLGGIVFVDADGDGLLSRGEGRAWEVRVHDEQGKVLMAVQPWPSGFWIVDRLAGAHSLSLVDAEGQEVQRQRLSDRGDAWWAPPLVPEALVKRRQSLEERLQVIIADNRPSLRSKRDELLADWAVLVAERPWPDHQAVAAFAETLPTGTDPRPQVETVLTAVDGGDWRAAKAALKTLDRRYRRSDLATWAQQAHSLVAAGEAMEPLLKAAQSGRAFRSRVMTDARRAVRTAQRSCRHPRLRERAQQLAWVLDALGAMHPR